MRCDIPTTEELGRLRQRSSLLFPQLPGYELRRTPSGRSSEPRRKNGPAPPPRSAGLCRASSQTIGATSIHTPGLPRGMGRGKGKKRPGGPRRGVITGRRATLIHPYPTPRRANTKGPRSRRTPARATSENLPSRQSGEYPLRVIRSTHEELTIAGGKISRSASAGALLVCPMPTYIRRKNVMGNVRRLLVLGLALAMALALAAPALAQAGEAQVRVAHLAPDAPNVDVYVDGEPVLTDVAYTTISGYLPLPAGAQQVTVYAAGDTSSPVIDVPVEVAAGGAYTIAAVGLVADSSLTAQVYEDDLRAPPAGPANAGVVHRPP